MPLERSKSPHAIVLVEDDPNVSLMLTRHLERAGHHVTAAGSIEAARQLLHERAWDLVLLDRALPDGDGIALCAELRLMRPHGYIIMLTGADSETDKVQGFASGADDYVTKPFHIDELLARVRAGLRIVDLQKRLLEMSLTDDLTGVKNRRAFDRELGNRFAWSIRYGRPFSIAAIDVDHFKQINDSRGHQSGDAILRGVACTLMTASRVTDFVARVGGEEFSVLLPETGLFEAIQFGEKIRATVASQRIEGEHVTVSVGVAAMPHSQFTTPEDFVFAADQALYRAKNGGRNRVESEKRQERFARRHEAPVRTPALHEAAS